MRPSHKDSNMHRFQHDFLNAFRAWDGFGMGAALIQIATSLIARECSQATQEHLVWSCRELLESMEGHPRLGVSMEVPEGPLTLIVSTEVKWVTSPQPLSHTSVFIEMRLGHENSQFWQRWEELGFSSEPAEIPRELVKTRIPLKGELGYDARRVGGPTIHKPTVIEPILATHTYAHACATERTENNEWLERYSRGDREQVWGEIVTLGPALRNPNLLPDAIAVIRETMRRCRTNVERIINRLNELDYPFQYPDEVYTGPDPNIWEQIADIEANVGPVPLALAAWYEIVGGVNLIPDSESEWNDGYPDPLVMYPSDYLLDYSDDGWHRYQYVLDISPDDYHKADTSGGAPYQITLPNACADTPLENESHQTTFVEYLRLSFKAGGFPGTNGKSVSAQWTKIPIDLLPI
jgi:hypothetical protein